MSNKNEAIIYYRSILKSISHDEKPIGKVDLDGNSCHYFTQLEDGLPIDVYGHQIAHLPLPETFHLVKYDYDHISGQIQLTEFQPIEKEYNNGDAIFLASIKNSLFQKKTYDYQQTAEDSVFVESIPLNIESKEDKNSRLNFLRWDYKSNSSKNETPLGCGTRCREAIFHGDRSRSDYSDAAKPILDRIIFFSKENSLDTTSRNFYIPCLGKLECRSPKQPAEVVYFKATYEELTEKWLKSLHKRKVDEMPGIADNYDEDNPQYPEETIAGVTIKYSDDISLLYVEESCVPLRVICP